MKLHEIIRTYRKQRGLTQEQVADALGVTAPAVNKWENAASCPDIALLAPLARLLGIDVNTLLCFREHLTDRELNNFTRSLNDQLCAGSYADAFACAQQKIRAYPTCDKLMLVCACTLHTHLSVQRKLDAAQTSVYRHQITSWLKRVHSGGDQQLSEMAANQLCSIYLNDGDYANAQHVLDSIRPRGCDKRPMQAILYERQGKTDEAYKLYEQMVYAHTTTLFTSLQMLGSMAYSHKNPSAGARYVTLAVQIGELLGLPTFSVRMIRLSAAMQQRDAAQCLTLLRQIADEPTLSAPEQPSLYPHIQNNTADITEMRHILRQALETDTGFDFLRGNPEFQAIADRLP